MSNQVRDLVRTRLVDTLSAIQRNAGRDVPTITDDTVPFSHLPGFDSLCGVEAAVLFSERVGVEVDAISFVAPRTGKGMTVSEIVNSIVEQQGHQIAAMGGSTDRSQSGSSSDSSAA